jgi:RimJ/RimL family protein N-acetyltransferase
MIQEVEIMLLGNNVVLRTIKKTDLETISQNLNDVRNRGYENLELVSEEQLRNIFAETGFWEPEFGFLIIQDFDDNILGFLHFFNPFTKPFRHGYEISFAIYKPENWGKGYMTDALSIFVPYLFATKNIERIQALVHPDNIGSKSVLKKCHFIFEGIHRKGYLYRGRPTDGEVYSILRDECPPINLANA